MKVTDDPELTALLHDAHVKAWDDWRVGSRLSIYDFHAYLPMHRYIFVPTGELWPAASVNKRFGRIDGLSGSHWLDQHRAVEQMTWMPGAPTIIQGSLVSEGGWKEKGGCSTFSLYRRPEIKHGDPEAVDPWRDHVCRLSGKHADHLLDWLAHRAQRPGEKINHALVLGGGQGIGKDTILEPPKHAVGAWNFAESDLGDTAGGIAWSTIRRFGCATSRRRCARQLAPDAGHRSACLRESGELRVRRSGQPSRPR
jgi:hypothetical protein